MTEFLQGTVSLPRIQIRLEDIEKDASQKGIIPLKLVLVDGSNNVSQIIKLDGTNNEKCYMVSKMSLSYIEYMFKHTSPEIPPNITVQMYLVSGFPSKKDVIAVRYLQAMALNQDCTIRRLELKNDDVVCKWKTTPARHFTISRV